MTLQLSAESLDDLMQQALRDVLASGDDTAPGKGAARELRAVQLELTNPRSRLSRTESRGRVFSALGELCWYLSGSNSTTEIEYYIPLYRRFDEGGVVWGGYGPRLRHFDGTDQLRRVAERLKANPHSRRAVIQLFDHHDLDEPHEDVPCTCSLQFFVRHGLLEMIVYMRSNDAYVGLPHDVFAFTILQEVLARDLEVDLGTYVHVAGSFHIYASDFGRAQRFIDEGWHLTTPMPPLPGGNPWPGVDYLLEREQALRAGGLDPLEVAADDEPYWSDLVRLLGIYALWRQDRFDERRLLQSRMRTPVFNSAIADKAAR